MPSRSAPRRSRLPTAAGRVLAEPRQGTAHATALPRFGDGRLRGARRRSRRRPTGLRSSAKRPPARRSAARSAKARRCASSPARRCRTAPTRSSSRRMRGRIDAATVEVVETVAAGRHIRKAGLDFRQGETLLDRHRVLDAAALSLAASANHATLPVVAPAAGRHHRHRRRIAAAGQHARPRPDHFLQRLWRRRDRPGDGRRRARSRHRARPQGRDVGAHRRSARRQGRHHRHAGRRLGRRP